MPDEEKTEPATPRRRSEARERGQVARSQDLTMALLLLSAACLLTMEGTRVGSLMISSMKDFLQRKPLMNFGVLEAAGILRRIAVLVGTVVGPMIAGLFLMAVIASVIQVGLKWSPKAMEFRPEKFNPVQGLKKLIDLRGIMRMLFSLAKLFVLAGILWMILKDRIGELLNLGRMELPTAAHTILGTVIHILWVISVVLIILGIGDYIYQRWQHERDLRMTKQEVKDEMKNIEGDPLIKNRIKQAQRRMARLRMMQEVPKADVVITNPTHAAVALKYDEITMAAPTVIAKGWNEVALRIRKIAEENGVPVYEDAPLARGLCSVVEIGEEIPVKFYKAVAAVLSHVYKLAGRRPGETKP